MFTVNDISVYIFSWKRVSHQTAELFRAVHAAFPDVTMINCDESHSFPDDIQPCLQFDDSFYYGGQFQAAIRNCKPGKIFCCIVGDVKPEGDWVQLSKHTVDAFNSGKVGIFAPNVDFTDHVAKGAHAWNNLYHVPNTDCTCWFIHPSIADYLRPIKFKSLSNLGWGIDTLCIEEANRRGLFTLRDYDVLLLQPKGRGYSNNEAHQQMQKLRLFYEEYKKKNPL